jgi:hypothetical protein
MKTITTIVVQENPPMVYTSSLTTSIRKTNRIGDSIRILPIAISIAIIIASCDGGLMKTL